MASCETTRFLVSILDSEIDRIAIIRTSSPNEWASSLNVVAPLNHIRMHKLKSTLDDITTSSPESYICNAADSLRIAQQLLLESRVDDRSTESPSLRTYGHIFLFTTHIDDSFPHFVFDDRITLHIVCASALPQKDRNWPRTNGWKLRSLTSKEPRARNRKRTDDDLDDLAQELKKLVRHARSGQRLGLLDDVNLDVGPGPDMIVEEILGSKIFPSLQPGEVCSVIIKVRCKRPKATEAWLSGGVTGTDDDDLFGELETMLLGFTATPVLHAALMYSHPLLPNDAACCVGKKCHVRRFITAPGDPDIIRKPASILESAERVTVHQRLAFHYFTQLKLQDAMSALQKVIGVGDGRMACPEYVALLMKEQQYQARIMKRTTFSNAPTKFPRNEVESQSPGLGFTKQQDGQVDVTEKLEESAPTSPKPRRRYSVIANNKSVPAKKIWAEVRKKWLAFEAGNTIPSSEEADERKTWSQKMSSIDKRSTETEPLRSLSLSVNNSSGHTARWA